MNGTINRQRNEVQNDNASTMYISSPIYRCVVEYGLINPVVLFCFTLELHAKQRRLISRLLPCISRTSLCIRAAFCPRRKV